MPEDKLINKKKALLPRLLQLYRNYYFYRSLLDELVFFITYKCNFKCKTCFYTGHMNESIRKGIKELTLDEISKISFSLGRLDKLLLSGGEPFLRDDLPQICEIFCRQNKINTIHLPTNGFYPEKIYDYLSEILNKCLDTEFIVSLSLDGFEQTHDKIKGVPGSFEKVIMATERLASLKKRFDNLTVNIISVVNNLNVDEIVELSEFVKNNLSVDGHCPSPVRGVPYDKKLSPPDYKKWENLSINLMKYRGYWDRKRTGSKLKSFLMTNKMKYLYKVYVKVLKGEKLPFKCQAGNIIAVLEPNGDVRLCELTGVVGNVCSAGYDLRRVLSSNEAAQARDKIKKCACTHACFLDCSIKMNPVTLIKSYFLG